MIISIKKCVIPVCEGADHRFEFERPTLREIKRMQEVAGIDVGDFQDGMNAVLGGGLSVTVIDVLLSLVDILHRREGIRVPFEEVDLDMPGLDFEFEGEDENAEEQAGDEAGKDPAPTSPSQPPADEAGDAPGSGDATEAESEPRSAPTPPSSGGGTD